MAISGATGSSYSLGDADVGRAITLTVTYTDGNGTAETLTSSATLCRRERQRYPLDCRHLGTATEGQTLTADTSAISDDDGLSTFSYQWNAPGPRRDLGATPATTASVMQTLAGRSPSLSYTDGNSTSRRLPRLRHLPS